MRTTDRRSFIKRAALLAAGTSFLGRRVHAAADPLYRISLAEWSLNRPLFNGELDNLDFPAKARSLGVEGVEYVNQFFMDKARDRAYLTELNQRAADADVANVLIMVDREGRMGAADAAARTEAVENHYKWVEAAQFLGCHSIRVNAYSEGSYEEQQRLVADGLRRLCEFADDYDLNVLVENHGGLSSNGKWLVGVMELVDHPRVGTLPDFGNFRTGENEEYDRYLGVRELMPYAKAVSAKTAIGADGLPMHTDYGRMMRIVLDAGYRGFFGIESGSQAVSPEEAVIATRKLLETLREELTPEYT